jgi:hypothetical protein
VEALGSPLILGGHPNYVQRDARIESNRSSSRPPSARTLFCQPVELGYLQWGTVEEGTMIKLMIDAVLFSCMGALIAGIVAGGAVFISY